MTSAALSFRIRTAFERPSGANRVVSFNIFLVRECAVAAIIGCPLRK
jgi:hypothetical protein